MLYYLYHFRLGYEPPMKELPDLWKNGMYVHAAVSRTSDEEKLLELLKRGEQGNFFPVGWVMGRDSGKLERAIMDGDIVLADLRNSNDMGALPLNPAEWSFIYQDKATYLKHCEGGKTYIRAPYLHCESKGLVRIEL